MVTSSRRGGSHASTRPVPSDPLAKKLKLYSPPRRRSPFTSPIQRARRPGSVSASQSSSIPVSKRPSIRTMPFAFGSSQAAQDAVACSVAHGLVLLHPRGRSGASPRDSAGTHESSVGVVCRATVRSPRRRSSQPTRVVVESSLLSADERTRMAIGIRIKLPGITQEQFDTAHDDINPTRTPPTGSFSMRPARLTAAPACPHICRPTRNSAGNPQLLTKWPNHQRLPRKRVRPRGV